jgi:hypothetical protein
LKKAFSNEGLDGMMRVTKPSGWVALAVIGLLICAALVWGVLGSLEIKYSARGILLEDGATGREKAVLFLPLAEKYLVRPQYEVYLSPSGFPSDRYGYLLGRVREVGNTALSQQNMMDILKNEALVSLFYSTGPQVLVTVDLQPGTVLGVYRWTSQREQPAAISPGSLTQASIVIERKPPLALLLPG